MRALATRSGLSQPFLSAVERGLSMPSIATLYRIAEALDVAPSTLLPVSASGDIQVVRATEGRMVPSSERPGSAIGRLVFADEHQGLEVFEYVMDDGRRPRRLVRPRRPQGAAPRRAASSPSSSRATPPSTSAPGDCLVHAGRIPHRWTVDRPGHGAAVPRHRPRPDLIATVSG